MIECGWEGGQTLEVQMYHMIIKHLTLIQGNVECYFPNSEEDYLASKMWELDPFSDDRTDHFDALLELKDDYF